MDMQILTMMSGLAGLYGSKIQLHNEQLPPDLPFMSSLFRNLLSVTYFKAPIICSLQQLSTRSM